MDSMSIFWRRIKQVLVLSAGESVTPDRLKQVVDRVLRTGGAPRFAQPFRSNLSCTSVLRASGVPEFGDWAVAYKTAGRCAKHFRDEVGPRHVGPSKRVFDESVNLVDVSFFRVMRPPRPRMHVADFDQIFLANFDA